MNKKILINSRLYINSLANQGSVRRQVLIISFAVILIAGFVYFEFLGEEKTEPILQIGLVITSPKPNEEISSPLKITGYVNGDSWIAFEGQAGIVKLLDSEEREITSNILTAVSEWTTLLVYFETNLEFQIAKDEDGTILFLNENPSGLPEKNKEFRLPVRIIGTKGETMKIKVYYNNSEMDPEFSCNKVFSVEREIPKTEGIARSALEELFKGPTNQEKSQGFLTSINPGVKIQKLIIDNSVVTVDFDEQLEYQVGGSCRVAAIRAQITETLKQFPTVEKVIISINDRTEDILQP